MTPHSNFALNCAQAQRAAEKRAAAVLFKAVKDILAAARTHRATKKRITRQAALLKKAQRITAPLATQLRQITTAYAHAADRILGTPAADTDRFLASAFFGGTLDGRNTRYLQLFAEDIVKLITAAGELGYDEQKTLSALRTAYRNPYELSVITKAKKNGAAVELAQHGKGTFHSAYKNLARNVRATVALAWSRAEQEFGKESGAVAYRVYRTSSFPCAVCDEEAAYVHHFGDPFPPFHVNCVCAVEFIYNEEGE